MSTVSILMPVRNGSPYLRNALDGLLSQSFADFEIFISDNASTDETESIIEEYKNKDGRIKCFRHKIMISAIENFCFVLNKCSSPYFMLAAHDDKHAVTFLEKCMQSLEKDGVVGAFSSAVVENYFLNTCAPIDTPLLHASNAIFKNFCLYLNCPYPSLVYGVFRREVLLCFVRHFEAYRDWSDCVLIYNIFSIGNIEIVPEELFVAGVPEEIRPRKTTRKDNKRVYEYAPFLTRGLQVIVLSKQFSVLQRIYLCLVHARITVQLFEHHEGRGSGRLFRCTLSYLHKGIGFVVGVFGRVLKIN